MKARYVAAILTCLIPTLVGPPALASSVEGLSGQWEHVTWLAGGEAVTIVRLTLIDFPVGTLSGSWQEVDCVVDGQFWPMGINPDNPIEPNAAKVTDTFSVQGKGNPGTFSISLDDYPPETYLGGRGNPPYGTAHSYGFRPWRETSKLFLLDSGDAFMFYPQSQFPKIGACGIV
jgi:hypothetical protein